MNSDIKPHNILLKEIDSEKDTIHVHLADFGLARNAESVHKSHVGGTYYFSPEILEVISQIKTNQPTDRKCFSFASDVFALGVTIYQLASSDMVTNLATVASISNNNLKDFIRKKVPQQFSNEFLDILCEMLNPNPNERITTDKIIEKLDKLLGGNNQKLSSKERYSEIKEIGRGANGIVFRAKRSYENSFIALKRIETLYEHVKREVMKEFDNMAMLSHENIVKTFGVFFAEKYIEIEMELMEGSLWDFIFDSKVFSQKLLLEVLLQTSQALKYIHARQIIHR